MKHSEFERLANTFGFAKTYFTAPMCFDFMPENEYNLIMDAKKAFPFASCIAVLVYPYLPFTVNERIPAYYLASNASYHACNDMMKALKDIGIRAERADVPLKSQLLASGIGNQCRNSLVAIPNFGTRIVLQALALDELEPICYNGENDMLCGECRACMDACPSLAIGENGLNVKKCMRIAMDNADHPDWVKRLQRTYVGCEVCQYACPRNGELLAGEPSNEAKSAFDTGKLIRGDTKAARALTGKNKTSNGKLTAEAIAMGVRDEEEFFTEYADELKEAERSPFEAVHNALRYAKNF